MDGANPEQYNVVEDLRKLLIPIEEFDPDPKNARYHPAHNIEAIKGSLNLYGQRTPIVANRRGGDRYIVEKGSGTLIAARALKWTHIAAVLVDDDDLTHKAYAVADNKTSDTSTWDLEVLHQLLGEIPPDQLLATGWNSNEIDLLLAGSFEPPPADDDFFDDNSREKTEVTTVEFSPEQWAQVLPALKAAGRASTSHADGFVLIARYYLGARKQ